MVTTQQPKGDGFSGVHARRRGERLVTLPKPENTLRGVVITISHVATGGAAMYPLTGCVALLPSV